MSGIKRYIEEQDIKEAKIMSKEDFIRIINGFDIKNINEYWLRVKGSDDLNFELMQGFADIKKSLERLDDLEYRIEKAIEMFNNETLNKYYYGMSYEFEINDFKEDILKILRGEDNE